MPRDLVIIGTGKLASNILEQLIKCDDFQVYMVGRNSDKLNQFVAQFPRLKKLHISEIPENAICLICVSDSAIAEISSFIPKHVSLVVHCSGSMKLDEISIHHENTAVVWPLQSFTSQAVNWERIPLIVEIKTETALQELDVFLKALSGPVSMLDFEHRKRLHLAAVIVNNFSNHIFAQAQDYCTKNDLPFNALQPLIELTVSRIGKGNLAEFQTGPANREDLITMNAHLELLKDDEMLRALYSTVSDSITNFSKNKKGDN